MTTRWVVSFTLSCVSRMTSWRCQISIGMHTDKRALMYTRTHANKHARTNVCTHTRTHKECCERERSFALPKTPSPRRFVDCHDRLARGRASLSRGSVFVLSARLWEICYGPFFFVFLRIVGSTSLWPVSSKIDGSMQHVTCGVSFIAGNSCIYVIIVDPPCGEDGHLFVSETALVPCPCSV